MAVARAEVINVMREELPRLLVDVPEIKYQLIGMLAETFAGRTDLQAVLERIDALREDFNRGFAEHSRRMDEQGERIEALREDFNRQFEEHSKRMDELREDSNRQFAEHYRRMDQFAQRQEEHSRRIDELREDFNRGFALLSRRIVRVDSHIGALGRRWGLMTESAFREGLAGILSDEFGLQVERYQKFDTQGLVFGQPDQVEIDVAIRDGQHILVELKASMSRNDVYAFQKKAAFYRREEGVEVKRMIIISPMFDPGAEAVAHRLGIETYTSAYDVQV